jgi:hypothetical protein
MRRNTSKNTRFPLGIPLTFRAFACFCDLGRIHIIEMNESKDNWDADTLFGRAEQLLKRHRDYHLTESLEPVSLAEFAPLTQRVNVPLQAEARHNETETLNRWLDGRVKNLVRGLNPLLPSDAVTVCELMFFHAYYVEAVRTRSHICSTDGKDGMRFPNIAALHREWELFSNIRLNDLPKSALTAREQSQLTNLLPMSERSVTNYVRRGLQVVFGLQLQKPKPSSTQNLSDEHTEAPSQTQVSPPANETSEQTPKPTSGDAESESEANHIPSVLERIPDDVYYFYKLLADLPFMWTWSARSAAFLRDISERDARRMINLMLREGLVSEYKGHHGEPEYRIAEDWHSGPDDLTDEHRELLNKLTFMPSNGLDLFGNYKGHPDHPDLSEMVHGKPYEKESWIESSVHPLTNQIQIRRGVRPTFESNLKAASGAELLLRKYGRIDRVLDWLDVQHMTLWLDQIPVMAMLERRLRIWRGAQAGLIALFVVLVILTGYLSLNAAFTAAGRNAIGLAAVSMFVTLLAVAGSGVLAYKHRFSWIRILWELRITPERR